MSDEHQDQPQEQLQENSNTLKNEIKNELKDEFKSLHKKRKRLVIFSVCIFALGVLIGFGGRRATQFDHHFEHGHNQEWHHFRR